MKEANIFYCPKLYYEIPTAKSRNGISIVPKLYNIHSLRFTDYKRRGHISLKPRLFSSKSFAFSKKWNDDSLLCYAYKTKIVNLFYS